MEILADISASLSRHTPGDVFPATPLDRLSLVRSSTPTMPMPNVYRPLLCLVAQGSKHVVLGDRVFTYTPARYGIVTHDLPVTGRVVEETPEKQIGRASGRERVGM